MPNYFWFHPQTMEFAGFHLVDGQYEALAPTDAGLLWSEQLQLFLGIYEGQLRWFGAQGQIVLLPEEAERQAKEQAQQRVEHLEAVLRSQGINPDNIA